MIFIKELCIGLFGNFLYSSFLFIYKQYYHKRYDAILERLEIIEKLLLNQQSYKKINNKNYYE